MLAATSHLSCLARFCTVDRISRPPVVHNVHTRTFGILCIGHFACNINTIEPENAAGSGRASTSAFAAGVALTLCRPKLRQQLLQITRARRHFLSHRFQQQRLPKLQKETPGVGRRHGAGQGSMSRRALSSSSPTLQLILRHFSCCFLASSCLSHAWPYAPLYCLLLLLLLLLQLDYSPIRIQS